MGKQNARAKTTTVTAIVPAYNEAERIGGVLSVLNTYPRFKEVIVVDDGSTDSTKEVVKQFHNVRYIKQANNTGKGGALDRGVQEATTELVFFCDADITGLTHEILEQIHKPVIKRQAGMSIAIQNRRAYFLNYLFVTKILRLVPVLAGQRVLTKTLWNKLPEWYKKNFRIEVGLNFYSKFYGKGYRYRSFRELGQVVKEKKYGTIKGLAHRCAMIFDISLAQIKLYALEVPHTVKSRRIALASALGNFVGILIGVGLTWMAQIGPLIALQQLFENRLEQERTVFIFDFLSRLVTAVSIELILLIGAAAIILNLFGGVLNLRRFITLLDTKKS